MHAHLMLSEERTVLGDGPGTCTGLPYCGHFHTHPRTGAGSEMAVGAPGWAPTSGHEPQTRSKHQTGVRIRNCQISPAHDVLLASHYFLDEHWKAWPWSASNPKPGNYWEERQKSIIEQGHECGTTFHAEGSLSTVAGSSALLHQSFEDVSRTCLKDIFLVAFQIRPAALAALVLAVPLVERRPQSRVPQLSALHTSSFVLVYRTQDAPHLMHDIARHVRSHITSPRCRRAGAQRWPCTLAIPR
eukprot:360680-Chlamydomonas_euryale.AAC.4